MSTPDHNPIPVVKPFGNTEDLLGFYQLLVSHVTWLAVHNFSKTTVEKRALYVKAFAMWCIDGDLSSPHVITKPILEAFQKHLFSYRTIDGKPLAWSSPSVPPPKSNSPNTLRPCPNRPYHRPRSNVSCSSPISPHPAVCAIESSSKFYTRSSS